LRWTEKTAESSLRDRKDVVFVCDFESDKWYEQFGMHGNPERVDLVPSDPALKFEPLAGKALRIRIDRGGRIPAWFCVFEVAKEPRKHSYRPQEANQTVSSAIGHYSKAQQNRLGKLSFWQVCLVFTKKVLAFAWYHAYFAGDRDLIWQEY